MTTTITPALGQGAVMNQATSYDAISARRFWGAGFQEGILSAGSYEVTQRGAGANLTVDIAASTGDGALVQGDAVTAQGLYHVPAHTVVINEAITTAHASLPRIDQVVLELKDHTHDASGLNLAQVRVVAGTATSGATLTNRTGAAALPSSALLLADVLVGAAAASITNAVIRDRRPWARGAYHRIATTHGAADYSTTSTTHAYIDSSVLLPRIECSGVPVRVSLQTSGIKHTVVSSESVVNFQVDGVGVDGTISLGAVFAGGVGTDRAFTAAVASRPMAFEVDWTFVPSAGSHLIGPAWATTGGASLFVSVRSTAPVVFTIEELVRPVSPNNITTTG